MLMAKLANAHAIHTDKIINLKNKIENFYTGFREENGLQTYLFYVRTTIS